jgi:predicted transposase YdaD
MGGGEDNEFESSHNDNIVHSWNATEGEQEGKQEGEQAGKQAGKQAGEQEEAEEPEEESEHNSEAEERDMEHFFDTEEAPAVTAGVEI